MTCEIFLTRLAGGAGDEEELCKENQKNTAALEGKITLSIAKSNTKTNEIAGVFESLQPSDTDLGSKAPKSRFRVSSTAS